MAIVGAAADPAPVKLMVLGETHGTQQVTRDLVKIATAKGATGCVCPGDFIYGDWGATPAGWKDMMRPLMGTMLPAQGNHDWPWDDWKGMFPGGKGYYSRDVNGVQFIALNPEVGSLAPGSTQRNWLDATLHERGPDALKVVLLHRPWWLPFGAKHPYTEFEDRAKTTQRDMDALMRAGGVDLVISAHEKNHQHSIRDGIHYVVAGGGGPGVYPLGYSLPGAKYRTVDDAVSTLDVTPGRLDFKTYDRSWKQVDSFSITGADSGVPPGDPEPPTPAPDPAPSLDATFAPGGGNDWWIQARVSSPADVARVDARVGSGPWVPLVHRSWGAWAASIHAPDGTIVTFRAWGSNGASVTSGGYSWPDASLVAPVPAPPPAPDPAAAAVTFAADPGNAWWVQVRATAEPGGAVARVDARIVDGTWHPLTLRSWGAWAASFHVPDGSLVEFRATGFDGGNTMSGRFRWPDAMPVAAPPPAAPPSPDPVLAATFTPGGGNEWWVQTAVVADASLAAVEARVADGAWRPLTLRAWGAWAASIHAPSGSLVEFRATAADGSVAASGPYTWPME